MENNNLRKYISSKQEKRNILKRSNIDFELENNTLKIKIQELEDKNKDLQNMIEKLQKEIVTPEQNTRSLTVDNFIKQGLFMQLIIQNKIIL